MIEIINKPRNNKITFYHLCKNCYCTFSYQKEDIPVDDTIRCPSCYNWADVEYETECKVVY